MHQILPPSNLNRRPNLKKLAQFFDIMLDKIRCAQKFIRFLCSGGQDRTRTCNPSDVNRVRQPIAPLALALPYFSPVSKTELNLITKSPGCQWNNSLAISPQLAAFSYFFSRLSSVVLRLSVLLSAMSYIVPAS